MSLLDILTLAAPQMANVKRLLESLKSFSPELAPQVDELLAQLDAPVAAENLARLAADILPELANILRGQIDPRPHAGDAI